MAEADRTQTAGEASQRDLDVVVVGAGEAEGPGLEQPIAMDPISRATTRALTSPWEQDSLRRATSRSETIRSRSTEPRVTRPDPHWKSEPGRYPLL